MNAPGSEFLRRYDTKGQSELDLLRLEVERLRDMIDIRAQRETGQQRDLIEESERRLRAVTEPRLAQAEEAAAALRQGLGQLSERFEAALRPNGQLLAAVAEALEPRIKFSAQEAIAYSEQRLERQEAALAALGRRFAEFARHSAPETGPETPALAAGAFVIGPAGEDSGDARRLSLCEDTEEAYARDAANLPIAPGGASRLVVARVIEHIAPAALEGRVLPHWRSRLAPGGELVVLTRDGPAFLADLAACEDFGAAREALFEPGALAWRNLHDPASLHALLTRAGLAPQAATRVGGSLLRVVAHA